MAYFGVMYRHDAVPTYPWLEAYVRLWPGHILMQQWDQARGCRRDPAAVRTVGRTGILVVSGRRQ